MVITLIINHKQYPWAFTRFPFLPFNIAILYPNISYAVSTTQVGHTY